MTRTDLPAMNREPFREPLATMSAISRACREIEAQMLHRLHEGQVRATYQPRADSFVVRWTLDDGRKVEADMTRMEIVQRAAPYGFLRVFLRHRLSAMEVR